MTTLINREQLAMLRDKLSERSTQLHEELKEAESTPASIESESQDYELAYVGGLDLEVGTEIKDHRLIELSDITSAVKRMDDGHYGICQDCGAGIGVDRLSAYPIARRCIECKQAFERQSGAV